MCNLPLCTIRVRHFGSVSSFGWTGYSSRFQKLPSSPFSESLQTSFFQNEKMVVRILGNCKFGKKMAESSFRNGNEIFAAFIWIYHHPFLVSLFSTETSTRSLSAIIVLTFWYSNNIRQSLPQRCWHYLPTIEIVFNIELLKYNVLKAAALWSIL